MHVVALAGGIGAGKSVAAARLRELGAVTVDLDGIVHDLLDNDSMLIASLVEAFGSGVLAADGRVSRRDLADIAFASERNMLLLEQLVHPTVAKRALSIVEAYESLPEHEQPDVLVFEVPLIEKHTVLTPRFDEVLLVSSDRERRIMRAVDRGMAREDVERRMARQVDEAQRRKLADHIFDNDGDRSDLIDQVGAWWTTRDRKSR